MSFYPHSRTLPQRTLPQRFRLVLSSFLQHGSLPFADVLDADHIQQAFMDEQTCFGEEEDAVYTPAITLWVFLSQVLHIGEQRSCVAAVARVITLLVALGKRPCAEDTGAYCRARAELSKSTLERPTGEISETCESQLPEKWLWRGRHVYLVDGTTVSMPDTSPNQAASPQQTGQREGLDFPIAPMVVCQAIAAGCFPKSPSARSPTVPAGWNRAFGGLQSQSQSAGGCFSKKTSAGVRNPRHARGRLLSRFSTCRTS